MPVRCAFREAFNWPGGCTLGAETLLPRLTAIGCTRSTAWAKGRGSQGMVILGGVGRTGAKEAVPKLCRPRGTRRKLPRYPALRPASRGLRAGLSCHALRALFFATGCTVEKPSFVAASKVGAAGDGRHG